MELTTKHRTSGLITLSTAAMIALTIIGCGRDVKSMEYEELKHLSGEDRTATLKGLNDEDKAAIMAAGMKYALSGDSTAINHKTLGELIEEGTEIRQRIKEQRQSRE